MTAPATCAVVAALTADGATVRFVGGCVRDALLGRHSDDIDIATPDRPETVVRMIEAAGFKAIPTGLAHGTITAVAGGQPFQITTLRTDIETFGRHARVAFTDDWTADAARRDFTFNALFADADGTFYDPFDGVADLEAGHVRFVGAARERIQEDYLRLLRFFRFYAYFGRAPADVDALAGCAALAGNLKTLSGERIRDETLKLLAAPAPEGALTLMTEADIWRHFLAEALPAAALGFSGLRALIKIEERLGVVDSIRRLGLLVSAGAVDARPLAARLRLSNLQRDRLQVLLQPPVDLADDTPIREQRAALYRFGTDAYRDLVLRSWAVAMAAGGPTDGFARLWSMPNEWAVPAFPVAGKDIVGFGVSSGPTVGRLMAAAETWWIEQGFEPDRAAVLSWIKDRLPD